MEVAYRLSQEEGRGGEENREACFLLGTPNEIRGGWCGSVGASFPQAKRRRKPVGSPRKAGCMVVGSLLWGLGGKGEEEGATEMDASLSCSPNLSRPFIRM